MNWSSKWFFSFLAFFLSFVLFYFVFIINFPSFRKFIYFATKIILQCGEKLSRVGKITGLYLSYPGRANFLNISLQNEASSLHERQKKLAWPEWWSALLCHPFLMVKSPSSPGQHFLYINPFARPAGSTLSKRTLYFGQSEHRRALLSRAKKSPFFPKRHIIAFSSYKQSLRTVFFLEKLTFNKDDILTARRSFSSSG